MREAFLVNPPRRKRHRGGRKRTAHRASGTSMTLKAKRRLWSKRWRMKQKRLGGGGGGKRRRRVTIRPRGHITITANPRRRYRKHRRNAPVMYANAPRRSYRRYPVRHRRYRRNPVSAGALGAPMDVMKNLPYLFTGAVAITATTLGPGFVPGASTSPWMKYGVQAAIVVGGGLVVGKMFGRTHGSVWAVTGGAVILADVLANFVLKPMGLFSGYEVDGYDLDTRIESYREQEEIGAYPMDSGTEFSAFPGDNY